MTRKARTFSNLRHPERTKDANREIVVASVQALSRTPEGRIFLDYLRHRTTFRALGPEVSDGALRALEGQRQLMHEIEGMILDDGRSADLGK